MTTVSLFETLDQWEGQMIADFSSIYEVVLMRASCLWASIAVAVPAKDYKRDLNWLLTKSAINSHKDICILAHDIWIDRMRSVPVNAEYSQLKHGSCVPPLNFNLALCYSRSRDICILAREWLMACGDRSTIKFHEMLYVAAFRGLRDICVLAYELAAREVQDSELDGITTLLGFNEMLSEAARGGHRDICLLAREWIDACGIGNTVDFNEMLAYAAEGGHRDLCELAREWIKASGHELDLNRMLTYAAMGNTDNKLSEKIRRGEMPPADSTPMELCNLVCEWNAERPDAPPLDFNCMLIGATHGGHCNICELAYERLRDGGNVPDFGGMLSAATGNPDPIRAHDLCILASNWITDSGIEMRCTDDVLLNAAKNGHYELCILARKLLNYDIKTNHDGMLEYAAALGGHRDICELVREWIGRAEGTHSIPGAHSAPANAEPAQSGSSSTTGASAPPLNFNMMLRGAAHGGHRNICILAREWAYNWARETQSKVSGNEAKSSDSLNFDIMLWYAAKRNHRDLCELARKWAREWKTQSQSLIKSGVPDYEAFPLNYTGILNDAARMGRQDLCELARELGREAEAPRANFNIMLRVAAEQGHQNICILARKWIDTSGAKVNFNNMLGGAARGGCRDLCILAKKWIDESGAKTNFDAMLGCAAEMGRRNICILAKKWIDEAGATGTRCVPANFNKMLKEAARNGYKSLCILAKKWIDESDSKGVAPLRKAQSTGTRCVPADFNKMLEGAAKGGHRDLCILAREWAREINARHPFSVMLNFDMMRTCRDDIRELAHEWVATCH